MSTKSANGVKGVLLRVGLTEWVFRVYAENNTFVDYNLHHSDLCVTITDEDAFFYQDEHTDVLDHSPATLGKEL